jgi:hypothetical protein
MTILRGVTHLWPQAHTSPSWVSASVCCFAAATATHRRPRSSTCLGCAPQARSDGEDDESDEERSLTP